MRLIDKILIVVVGMFVLGFLGSMVRFSGYKIGVSHNQDYQTYFYQSMEREDMWIELLRRERAK